MLNIKASSTPARWRSGCTPDPDTHAAPATITRPMLVRISASTAAAASRRVVSGAARDPNAAYGFAWLAMKVQKPSKGDFGARSRSEGSGSSVCGKYSSTAASAASGEIPTARANVRTYERA